MSNERIVEIWIYAIVTLAYIGVWVMLSRWWIEAQRAGHRARLQSDRDLFQAVSDNRRAQLGLEPKELWP